MTEAILAASTRPRPVGHLVISIGWRNLWRNRSRTWLTAGGIAFAISLVVFGMSFQHGVYEAIETNASTLLTGHVQIQRSDYIDDSRMEMTIADATSLMRTIEQQPHVLAVAPRLETFALASADERSFGVFLLGVDFEREQRAVQFFDEIGLGRMPQTTDEAIIGTNLARNLSLEIGDEMIILGSAKEGGVAALALTVVGIFESGIGDMDRNMVAAPIATVQNGFGFGDDVHTLIVRADELEVSKALAKDLQRLLPAGQVARSWNAVMPEIEQGLMVDKIGGQFMYWIIMILVSLSIVNSFIMTVFERTREFGMLMSIGMRPGKIIALVQVEAFCMWLIGASIGVVLASASVLTLAATGVSLGEGMEEYVGQMYLPSVLYPALGVVPLLTAPVVLLVGTQLAALLPSLKINRLKPVEALRLD
ncbi:MAG: ABC transporter permease [Proteobacteria bacterium]|nr:ABC transporter permease [Pseudomonadota bacterium]